MSKRAPIISISGPDGSGKSTVIEHLSRRLEETGEETIVVWSRLGYTSGFEKLKRVARRSLGKQIPQQGDTRSRADMMSRSRVKTTWLFLACIDLVLTYGFRIRRLASRGKTVICDRFVWDALIDRQIYYPESAWPEVLIRRGYGQLGAKPDLSFLLSVPLEVSKQRSEAKDEPFPDSPAIRTARHALYRDLEADPTLRVLNATRPPDQIVDEILKALPAR